MRGLIVTLLVLVGLLVAADFGARALAEDRVGTRLQGSLDLPVAPDVDVNGFPFLTQAAAGRYDDVTLTAEGIRYGELADVTLAARLSGVALPPQSLLDGRVSSIPADAVVAEARVGPADLARVLDVSDVSVEPVTPAGLGRLRAEAAADDSGASGSARALARVDPASSVRLVSTRTVLGRPVRVSVVASFRLSEGQITLSARDLRVDSPGGAAAVGGAAASALRDQLSGFSVRVDPGELPFSITASRLTALDGMLVVSGTARDVDLLRPAA